MSVRFEMRVDDALMARIDAARDDVSRASWIKGAIVGRLDLSTVETPAPRRAPAPEKVREVMRAKPAVESAGESYVRNFR